MDQLKYRNPLKIDYYFSDAFFSDWWSYLQAGNSSSPILFDTKQSKFKVQDSFTFVDADKILTQGIDLDMPVLDVDSFFTKISLEEAIDICVNKLIQNPESFVNGISKNYLRDLLNLATIVSFFTFNNI